MDVIIFALDLAIPVRKPHIHSMTVNNLWHIGMCRKTAIFPI
jgi:hypothetical protein